MSNEKHEIFYRIFMMQFVLIFGLDTVVKLYSTVQSVPNSLKTDILSF